MIKALPKTFEDGIRSIHDKPQMPLGEVFHSTDEMTYMSYVRFAEDVKVGDAVRTKYKLHSKDSLSPQTNGGSVYAPAGSEIITEHDATYLTRFADGNTEKPAAPPNPMYRDYLEIAITAGAGAGQHGVIHEYTDKILNIRWYHTSGKYTDGLLTTALDTTSAYEVTAPWYVEKIDQPTSNGTSVGTVNGIVLADAKELQYGLIMYCGEDFVRPKEGVSPGETLYPAAGGADTDEGEGETPTAAPLFAPYATVLSTMTANQLVRAQIYCVPISIVRDLPQMQDRGFDYPT